MKCKKARKTRNLIFWNENKSVSFTDDFDISWRELNVDNIDHVIAERMQLKSILDAAKIDDAYDRNDITPRYLYPEHTSHDQFIQNLQGGKSFYRSNRSATSKSKSRSRSPSRASQKHVKPKREFGTQTIVKRKKRRRRKKSDLNTLSPTPPNRPSPSKTMPSPRHGKLLGNNELSKTL